MIRILLGVPVHQDEDIFREYMASLDRLIRPEGVELDRCFYLHDARHLKKYLRETDSILYNDKPISYEKNVTHIWNHENLSEVARMKNEMMRICVNGGYDYYFLVDSDLILHPNTLKVLLDRNAEIVSEVFWTEWLEGSGQILPNCWDRDQSDIERVERYRVPGLHQTGGTGALILIKSEVLKVADYTPLGTVSWSVWEDRAFAIRAECHGYKSYIDTTLPARHLYRRSDYENYIKKKGGTR